METILRLLFVVTITVAMVGIIGTALNSSGAGARNAGTSAAGQGSAPAKPHSPVIDALDSTLHSQEKALGNFGKQLRSDLARADEEFQLTKRRNREAIQQANRRVRPHRASPHLLLVLVQGLTTDAIHCYNESAPVTPGYDGLAERGVRLKQFEPARHRSTSSWTCLVEGETTPNAPRPQSLVTVLWQSGYDTAFVGDASRFAADPRKLRFDHWYGFHTVAEASERIPSFVWSDEERISLNQADGAVYSKGKLKSSHQVLLEEVAATLSSPAQSRPVFAIASIRAVGWTPAELDAIPMVLMETLKQSRLISSTIVMIAGIAENPSSGMPVKMPFLVSWPGKFEAGADIDEPTGWADIATTICEIAEVSPRQTLLRGRSQLNDWKSPGHRTQNPPASQSKTVSDPAAQP